MIGLGEPRVVRAGVVGGSYFEVMGLRPVRGRLLDATDDGPKAAGAAVLTYRFWTTTLGSDPAVLGKTIRLGSRTATIVGVLEPSVPYPAETEIIANVVTSPHHLDATMVDGRVHRMTELFGRLAPGVDLDAARAELRASTERSSRSIQRPIRRRRISGSRRFRLRDQITSPARTVLLVLLAASGLDLHHRLLERREPDSRALGAARRGTGDSRRARRERRCAAADAARREPVALRRRGDPRRSDRPADGRHPRALRGAVLGAGARPDG